MPGDDRRMGTLLPPMKMPANSRYSALIQQRHNTLGSLELWQQVKCPGGASEEEWIALSTVDMFNEINLLAGAVQDLCTNTTCPEMNAGLYTFQWADETTQVPVKLSAPQYFERLLKWVEKQLTDETFVPVEPGVPFPPTFKKGMKVIYKRLFRIYAHIFHAHYQEMMEVDADAHLNHSFQHFVFFVKEFQLVTDQELEPLKDLVKMYVEKMNEGKRAKGEAAS